MKRGMYLKFVFGDIVVVKGNLIGVVVKSWTNKTHDVYVRELNSIVTYHENEMDRYMVRHKYLNDEELEYQNNAVHGF
jgi:hypothetical protein